MPTEPINPCDVCGRNVKRQSRSRHVTCDEAAALPAPERPAGARECMFCHSWDTTEVDGGAFCFAHMPDQVRHARTVTALPERCGVWDPDEGKEGRWVKKDADGVTLRNNKGTPIPACGEALTYAVTKGGIKCRCDQPTMPRHLRNNGLDDRPPMQVRYGN